MSNFFFYGSPRPPREAHETPCGDVTSGTVTATQGQTYSCVTPMGSRYISGESGGVGFLFLSVRYYFPAIWS